MLYKDWLNKWVSVYIKPIKKFRTYQKYLKEINLHIIPKLGEIDLNDLTSLVLQEFVVDLLNEGLSSNTVNGIISVLKQTIKQAFILKITNIDNSSTIIRPKIVEQRVECFSKTEQEQIEKYIIKSNNHKLFGIIICLYTGIRIGELLGLKWESNIDFKNGILKVTQTALDSWDNGRYVKILQPPKTNNSIREIPLSKELLAKLKELKNKSNCPFVVMSKSEYGVSIRSYQKTFELLLKNLKKMKIGL